MGFFLVKTVINFVNLGEYFSSQENCIFPVKRKKMGKISRNGQEYTSSVKRERHLPCPDVRVGLEVLGTVLILEQRPPMAS